MTHRCIVVGADPNKAGMATVIFARFDGSKMVANHTHKRHVDGKSFCRLVVAIHRAAFHIEGAHITPVLGTIGYSLQYSRQA